jgi:predicted nucleic acid-binding protein
VTPTPIISNASPLIALEQIGHLSLLKQLFGTIRVPPAVANEVAPTVVLPPWVERHELAQPIGPQILGASLGPGESEAVSLALETGAQLVLLDDRPARRLARALHLPVMGTLGILLTAKRHEPLPTLRPHLYALLQHGFRVAPALYENVLNAASEGSANDQSPDVP